ncbi:ribbon-helix-helix protein, CopG family [Silvibacterium acidisoli]|uniref:ribbon-helix-helix protein, CopG family n=1 Tax=Acidobacteriaceae bacterium ZG23-2 TaxID=2883246 RepID=UPI00406C074D
MPATRKSRVYTISLPPELAKEAEAIAEAESRTMSDLFREAFRTYRAARAVKALEAAVAIGAGANPRGYTEEDIPRLLKEVRAERDAKQEHKVRAAG